MGKGEEQTAPMTKILIAGEQSPCKGQKETLACIPSQTLAWVSQQMHARGSLTAYPTRPSRGFKDSLGREYRKRKEATAGFSHPAVAPSEQRAPTTSV